MEWGSDDVVSFGMDSLELVGLVDYEHIMYEHGEANVVASLEQSKYNSNHWYLNGSTSKVV